MIWTFERGDEVLRLETRIDNATREFLIVSTWAERPPEIERFQDPAEYHVRVRTLEVQLTANRWSQIGSPHSPLRRLARPNVQLRANRADHAGVGRSPNA
jgi:hypothetical protein